MPGLPDQIVGHLVLGVGVGIVRRWRVRVDLQRHACREDGFGLGEHLGVYQQVATVVLHHTELPRIELLELLFGDVDALDLAAVFEVAGDVGVLAIQRLAFQQRMQLRSGLAFQPRRFLLGGLGCDAFFLFLLRAYRIGLGEINLASLAGAAARFGMACRVWLPSPAFPAAWTGLARSISGLSPDPPSPREAGLAPRLAGDGASRRTSGLGAGLKPRPSNWSRRDCVMNRLAKWMRQ